MISLLFPWRGADPWRLSLKAWTAAWWRAALPEAEHCQGGGPLDGPFNRSAAINEAAQRATGSVFIIADTDTVPQRVAVREGLRLVADRPILPYTAYYNLDPAWTSEILAQSPKEIVSEPTVWEHRLEDSVSGCVIVSREMFERVGGFDPRFVAWGYEDRAFMDAVRTWWGVERISSFVVHLWHPAPESGRFGSPEIMANRALYARYAEAAGDRSRMERLIAERGT